jgi:hypothetical protein
LFGSWGYLVDTIKGKIKPNKVSWLLWSIAPMIAFLAMVKQGVGITSLATFVVGFVPLIIFIASFVNKDAKWEIGNLDIICGTLSLLGLLLWIITKVGNVAIIFSIVADGLAALPTIVKSYHFPETENSSLFFFGVINSVIAILALTTWNFESFGFPLYLIFINLFIAVLIQFKLGLRLSKKKN